MAQVAIAAPASDWPGRKQWTTGRLTLSLAQVRDEPAAQQEDGLAQEELQARPGEALRGAALVEPLPGQAATHSLQENPHSSGVVFFLIKSNFFVPLQ